MLRTALCRCAHLPHCASAKLHHCAERLQQLSLRFPALNQKPTPMIHLTLQLLVPWQKSAWCVRWKLHWLLTRVQAPG